jgi:hypothetical protein
MNHQIRTRGQKVPLGEPVTTCKGAKHMSGGIGEWLWRRKALRGEVDCYRIGSRLYIPTREIRRIVAEGYKPRIAAEEQRGVAAQGGQ